MARLVSSDGGMRGADVGSTKYDRQKDGSFHVDNPKHAALMKSEGFFQAADASFGNVNGYPCECGFSSLFRKCSKCGKVN